MLYTFTRDPGSEDRNDWGARAHRRLRQAGLDRADGAGLLYVLAHRPGDPGLHHMERTDGHVEWTDGMRMAWRRRGVAPAGDRPGEPNRGAYGAPAGTHAGAPAALG